MLVFLYLEIYKFGKKVQFTKMFPFLRSLSRTVHKVHEEHHEEDHLADESSYKSLTVWRKSLVLSCNGFTVIDSDGDLVYRVDNYSGHPSEIILMDGYGKSKFTIHRRKVIILCVCVFLCSY